MIKTTFKNLEKSDLAREVVEERIGDLVEKFPELSSHSILITLSMDNSSAKSGPDEFGVKLHIKGKKFDDLIMEKKSGTLYRAVADVVDAMLERLNRRTDKMRITERSKSRKAKYVHESQGNQDAV